jgi:hypothetical protein
VNWGEGARGHHVEIILYPWDIPYLHKKKELDIMNYKEHITMSTNNWGYMNKLTLIEQHFMEGNKCVFLKIGQLIIS